jgi:hypothetical protein
MHAQNQLLLLPSIPAGLRCAAAAHPRCALSPHALTLPHPPTPHPRPRALCSLSHASVRPPTPLWPLLPLCSGRGVGHPGVAAGGRGGFLGPARCAGHAAAGGRGRETLAAFLGAGVRRRCCWLCRGGAFSPGGLRWPLPGSHSAPPGQGTRLLSSTRPSRCPAVNRALSHCLRGAAAAVSFLLRGCAVPKISLNFGGCKIRHACPPPFSPPPSWSTGTLTATPTSCWCRGTGCGPGRRWVGVWGGGPALGAQRGMPRMPPQLPRLPRRHSHLRPRQTLITRDAPHL